MRLANERASVRVPATTANMGPGFDSFGMAFRYYDEVEVRPVAGATHVRVEGVGEGVVPTGDDNLVVRALRAGLDAVGAPQAGFEMRCVNRIPHGGGMGSSASAAVAGLMLARGLLSEPQALSDDEVFLIATRFEGHPDNVAPAVFSHKAFAAFVYLIIIFNADTADPSVQSARFRVSERQALNVFHADKVCVDFFGHCNAVAYVCRIIRRSQIFA